MHESDAWNCAQWASACTLTQKACPHFLASAGWVWLQQWTDLE